MSAICSLVPVYVFTALLRQFWFSDMGDVLSVWKPVALITLFTMLYLLAALLITAWQTHCPVGLLLKKVLPPFLLALTASSSMAAFQTSMDTGRDKLGIDPAFLRFAYPIGNVMYMPIVSIALSVFAVHFASVYGVGVSLSWFVAAALTASLLAIAVPPLPGAGLMIFSTLFAQLGIPEEALLFAALMYIPLDYVATGGNVGALLLELTREAGGMNLLDREKLLRP